MEEIKFASRRSVVHSTQGIAAATQPLAASVGVKILEQGGNAADAAVAMAAAMGVVEPMMTGIGGDAFCLYYDAATKKVSGFNGSGKSSRNVDLAAVKEKLGPVHMLPVTSGLAVNVPGAPAAWIDIIDKWGSSQLSLAQILAPAIKLARDGYPVSSICARMWANGESKLRQSSPETSDALLPPPKTGDFFSNPLLANVYEKVAAYGKDGYYRGAVADAIVEAVTGAGGVLSHEDLENHKSLVVDPISLAVGDTGVNLHELPPNNHGIVALLALGIMNHVGIKFEPSQHNSPEYLHLLIEALKFAFKDAEHYVGDAELTDRQAIEKLLSPEFIESRAKLFSPGKANLEYEHGVIPETARSDTSYFTVVDKHGNACSIIASLYMGFGSGIVPRGCGFALHNRGCNFSLDPASSNAFGPSKRSYHTIIPAMLTTASNELYASYGVMGGFMQPQGHVQVALNMLVFGLNPQEALDAPRICLAPHDDTRGGLPVPHNHEDGVLVQVEEGIDDDVVEKLRKLGHAVQVVKGAKRSVFGRGQVIQQTIQKGVKLHHAGSDLRGDGEAIPQV